MLYVRIGLTPEEIAALGEAEELGEVRVLADVVSAFPGGTKTAALRAADVPVRVLNKAIDIIWILLGLIDGPRVRRAPHPRGPHRRASDQVGTRQRRLGPGLSWIRRRQAMSRHTAPIRACSPMSISQVAGF
jgi:hypothetical protein